MIWGGEGYKVECVWWCFFEDVFGVGYMEGFLLLIVLGVGEFNYDVLEVNFFEMKK